MDTTPYHQLSAALADVDRAACMAYRQSAPLLIVCVDREMAERPDIADLLGPCSLEVLGMNHVEHARFMAAQLELRAAETITAMFVWAYQTHPLRGVALRSFPADLEAWKVALAQHLDPISAAKIDAVYQSLIDSHSQLMLLAQPPPASPDIADELWPYFQRYLLALLAPDARAALSVAEEYIHSPSQIAIWWEHVIRPTMYEIGRRWAQGEISVGQEHLATAITQRVIAQYYTQILDVPHQKGRVVIAASPGEFHDLGARILSDLIELNGWDVYYTGANTPAESIIALLAQTQAHTLCISTTIPDSLPAVRKLIAQVRAAKLAVEPRILVGGQAYRAEPGLWLRLGADGYASNAHEAIAYIEAA